MHVGYQVHGLGQLIRVLTHHEAQHVAHFLQGDAVLEELQLPQGALQVGVIDEACKLLLFNPDVFRELFDLSDLPGNFNLRQLGSRCL